MTTNNPELPHPPPAAQTGQPSPRPEKNTLGLVALIMAVIGFIFACIPGALIVGWILLPVSFILALVSLFQAGPKKLGIIALIVSIVGTLVGFIVFFAVVADAVDEAFSDGDTKITTPDDADSNADSGSNESDSDNAAAGTRGNPLPIGSTVENDDWTVTINSVDLDATDKVMAENQFNDEPGDGNVYILINVTATYTGDDGDGETPWVSIDYVTSGGNTFAGSDSMAVAPDQFDSFETLYNGASTSGNMVIEVPADGVANGTLAVNPSMFGDKVFFAVK